MERALEWVLIWTGFPTSQKPLPPPPRDLPPLPPRRLRNQRPQLLDTQEDVKAEVRAPQACDLEVRASQVHARQVCALQVRTC